MDYTIMECIIKSGDCPPLNMNALWDTLSKLSLSSLCLCEITAYSPHDVTTNSSSSCDRLPATIQGNG